jgi:serine/threonine protein kinase
VTLDPLAFTGTDRFVVERCLGSGGFGTVYQTYDRLRRARVALKILHQADPVSLLGLKREFRSLADLSHPNLVSLHELLTERDQWFITMEHIDGSEFVSYINDLPRTSTPDTRAIAATRTMSDHTTADAVVTPRPLRPPLTTANIARIEDGLRQLANGLVYLHGEGRLHRDIKPSNVLVTDEGRVVLLDFGLVTELESFSSSAQTDFIGTPAYMAPLRDSRGPFGPADDWYSVGVMLFEALTGTLPFTGSLFEILQAKSAAEAQSPRALVPSVPAHLDELCRGLLARDPARRLDAATALTREAKRGMAAAVAAAPGRVPLIGRVAHLEALHQAYRDSRSGHAVTVYVHGSSGMGKTALVRAFLRSLASQPGSVVVSSGRCFERESVPYKALDSIVDSLSDYLRTLPSRQIAALLPRDIQALARVFTVLRRIDEVEAAQHRVLEIPDAVELRRRAFAAFRELMVRIATKNPVVLFIDDLQWGDEDSAALLAELLRQPDAPPLLLIATYRSEEADSSAALRRLLPRPDANIVDPNIRQIAVTELTPEESKELTAMLRSSDTAVPDDTVLREAGGNPFLISQLVRYAKTHDSPAAALSLDEVIHERVKELPDTPRHLLEVLSVFGQPLDQELANRAAGIESGAMEAVSMLRAQHLSRTRVMDQRQELETYHDRIRETVVSHLSPDRLRSHHRSLANTLVLLDDPDPEILSVHFHGAGETVRAAGYSVAAAERASDKLAFERAARLYRQALDLDPSMAADRQVVIQGKLGDALASAGRGGQAASAYLAAAALDAEPRHELELRRRAAEQQLRSGQIDAGFDTIRSVLGAIGMSLAPTPRRALLAMLWQRLKIRLRGLSFVERDVSEISPEELMRIDTCWSVAMGLGIVDNIRGADFQGRHLLLALNAGEPYRVARALGMEVAYAVVSGGRRARERSRRIGEMAQALAERVNHPQALGLVSLTRGTAASLQGDYRTALELCERAEQILDERCTGVGWELAATHLYSLLSLVYLGELSTLSRRLPLLIQEARERDDLNAVANLRTRLSYIVSLAADDVPGAREEVRQGIAVWSRKGFTAQHFFELQALVDIAIYEDDGAEAWAAVARSWDDLAGSLLLRVQRVRIESQWFRIRAAIAAAAADPARRAELLRDAERTERQLRATDAPQATPMAIMSLAGIAATAGKTDLALRHLEEAIKFLEPADMPLHLAATRRRLGEMRGDDALIAIADRWMTEHGVRTPASWARMLVPGNFARA